MKYNFDEVVNRWGTDSIKYDGPKEDMGSKPYIPMWVADMDFKTPEPIVESIQEALEQGVLGYTKPSAEWAPAIQHWLKTQHKWEVATEELIYTPGIVRGLTFVLRCFTQHQDKVLIMSPVYPPFTRVPELNERQVVRHSLRLEAGQYEVDWEQLAVDMKGCKLFILCNPHNPGGRVWRPEELQKIAELAQENNTLVISDEIHADLSLPAYPHTSYATVSSSAAQNAIVFMSPSKAFNMPGLGSAYAIIQNADLRQAYQSYVEALDMESGHMFSYSPLVAAYTLCEDWLPQLLPYLQANIDYVEEFLASHCPRIQMIKPQASYLIFLDCRALKLTDEELDQFFRNQAGLILNPGISFGPEGSGFMRLNIGCPKSTLETAMRQLAQAYQAL